jgi:hypothetical protein
MSDKTSIKHWVFTFLGQTKQPTVENTKAKKQMSERKNCSRKGKHVTFLVRAEKWEKLYGEKSRERVHK